MKWRVGHGYFGPITDPRTQSGCRLFILQMGTIFAVCVGTCAFLEQLHDQWALHSAQNRSTPSPWSHVLETQYFRFLLGVSHLIKFWSADLYFQVTLTTCFYRGWHLCDLLCMTAYKEITFWNFTDHKSLRSPGYGSESWCWPEVWIPCPSAWPV